MSAASRIRSVTGIPSLSRLTMDAILSALGRMGFAGALVAAAQLRHRTPGDRAADHASAQAAPLSPRTLRLMSMAGVLRAFRRPQ